MPRDVSAAQGQYQFVNEYLTFNKGIIDHIPALNLYHFNFGIDGISIYFVLLTTFITPIALLSNLNNIKINLPSPNKLDNNFNFLLNKYISSFPELLLV